VQAFFPDNETIPLPKGHRFPLGKYAALVDRVRALEPEGLRIEAAQAADDATLATVHDVGYVQAVQQGTLPAGAQREIGLPWSPALVQRARRSVGATVAAAQAAMREGLACNLAGGTHHAKAAAGGGFCIFNDVAVAARVLQQTWPRQVKRVAVVDLDVHQGNGTADIFANDHSVFTLSLHGEKNFPFRKARSSLDVPLPDDCDDARYLEALRQALPAVAAFGPDAVFYVAGADVLASDRLGRLALTPAGMAQRDAEVLQWTRALGIPMTLTMGGGYADPIDITVQAQAQTIALALQAWRGHAGAGLT